MLFIFAYFMAQVKKKLYCQKLFKQTDMKKVSQAATNFFLGSCQDKTCMLWSNVSNWLKDATNFWPTIHANIERFQFNQTSVIVLSVHETTFYFFLERFSTLILNYSNDIMGLNGGSSAMHKKIKKNKKLNLIHWFVDYPYQVCLKS